MFNFLKRVLVKFLVRNYKVILNSNSQEYYIVSHVSKDGYVVLLTQYDTYLPLQYSVFKKNFKKVTALGDNPIVGVKDNVMLLSSGHLVKLSDINESVLEESVDTSF